MADDSEEKQIQDTAAALVIAGGLGAALPKATESEKKTADEKNVGLGEIVGSAAAGTGGAAIGYGTYGKLKLSEKGIDAEYDYHKRQFNKEKLALTALQDEGADASAVEALKSKHDHWLKTRLDRIRKLEPLAAEWEEASLLKKPLLGFKAASVATKIGIAASGIAGGVAGTYLFRKLFSRGDSHAERLEGERASPQEKSR